MHRGKQSSGDAATRRLSGVTLKSIDARGGLACGRTPAHPLSRAVAAPCDYVWGGGACVREGLAGGVLGGCAMVGELWYVSVRVAGWAVRSGRAERVAGLGWGGVAGGFFF